MLLSGPKRRKPLEAATKLSAAAAAAAADNSAARGEGEKFEFLPPPPPPPPPPPKVRSIHLRARGWNIGDAPRAIVLVALSGCARTAAVAVASAASLSFTDSLLCVRGEVERRLCERRRARGRERASLVIERLSPSHTHTHTHRPHPPFVLRNPLHCVRERDHRICGKLLRAKRVPTTCSARRSRQGPGTVEAASPHTDTPEGRDRRYGVFVGGRWRGGVDGSWVRSGVCGVWGVGGWWVGRGSG